VRRIIRHVENRGGVRAERSGRQQRADAQYKYTTGVIFVPLAMSLPLQTSSLGLAGAVAPPIS
jgi:hypothetical protein